jgi:prepilin-type N-terminal cleavage/methylation domain-containing protein
MNSQFNQQHRIARPLRIQRLFVLNAFGADRRRKSDSVFRINTPRVRRAFTLVEMLVAMTLVLLMMTLFGEIFGLATGAMNLQRAIAENDQQIRTLSTVMRGDLQKRTFRNSIPFFPLESQDDPTTSFNGREGYFYISLNSTNNAVDNVLQFTVRSTILDELKDDTRYYGSAARLDTASFLANGNQPEHDDGEINPNGAGASTAAEVTYFVRSGNLYRRQMLIRDPLAATGADTEQPTRSDEADFFVWDLGASPPAPVLYTGDFWDDFDYAAYSRYSGAQRTGAGFVGMAALSNENVSRTAAGSFSVPLGTNPVSLGHTRFRFGFDPVTGLSREYGDSAGTFFIGRFTQEETSADNFNYPHMACEVSGGGSILGSGNPMDAAGTALTDDVDETGFGVPDGRVDEFQRNANTGVSAGPRVGEDLLITNVHEFRIDVWDQRINKYVPIGHSDTAVDGLGAAGDFHSSRNLNTAFAPTGGFSSVFDTWHSQYDRDDADGDLNDATGADNPPFRPMTWDPLGNSAPVPTNAGPDSFWDHTGMTDYVVGDVVFPPTEDVNLNGDLDAGEDGSLPTAAMVPGMPIDNPGQIDEAGQVPVHGRVYYYRCVAAGPGASTAQPPWGSTPGQYHRTSDGYLWQVQSNLRPLKAIRITVRFLHRQSGKMRQVTLIQPLTK